MGEEEVYNLILNKGTRQWEREQLIRAKNQLDTTRSTQAIFSELEASLRPLALRNTLTPDVHDFYYAYLTQDTRQQEPSHQKETLAGEIAIFAGGCFWCMVEPFDTYPGILAVESGYTGGTTIDPTYDQVLSGEGGHVEAVKITFDATIISYRQLVMIYFQVTDPTDAFGQFQDRGLHYQPIIFVSNTQQENIAREEKQMIAKQYHDPIVTKILPSQPFFRAETYHQEFYKKESRRYKQMRRSRKQLQKLKRWQQKIKQLKRKN